jgi:hypothetical protein
MIFSLILNNNLFENSPLTVCGLILGYSVYYLIKRKYTANLPTNTEALTNQEIENAKYLEDSDTETETTETDYEGLSNYDSASSSDFDEIVNDPDILRIPHFTSKYLNDEFIMPDLDLNICSLEELKLFEFCRLFSKEMAEKSVTEEQMIELISMFSKEELATNWINDLFLAIIDLL